MSVPIQRLCHMYLSTRKYLVYLITARFGQTNMEFPAIVKAKPHLIGKAYHNMCRNVRKLDIWLNENKGADQLCSNCTADQPLCFCSKDSMMLLLSRYEISSFLLLCLAVEPGLCQTTQRPVFSKCCSDWPQKYQK